ncbi:capsular biosynthesis protein [uncultured Azohydromonas sp.]|jgi:Capsule polysaccharide export protein|uniref:capsular biosynthesis protein n=1 Tax=uncultured Azohydromonas sp. TaxID=487342 RepID=UPI002621D529|nr:capsular biosynthesis protein [uncultured Azohydromonas sp.]
MRLIHWMNDRRLRLTLLVLPLVLALAYLVGLAANRYVSEATVVVRQANQSSGTVPGAALLLAGVTPSSREDTLYLRQYIQSLDLLKLLDEKLHVREHFATQAGRDPLYRLYGFFSQERFLDYYRNRVELLMDDNSGVLTVRVQGFDPEFAQKLNFAILEQSERFINAMSQNMAREQMNFAQTELDRASERLQAARRNLLAFQNKYKQLDPLAQAQATGTLAAELQAQLSMKEAELKQAQTFLNEDSYQIKALRGQIGALRSQAELEQRRATNGPANGQQLNAQAARFQELKFESGFAEDAYKVALTSMENARIEASRKIKVVSVIAAPSKPEIAEYPRRIYNLLTLAALCVLLYGVARLVVATIRDHQD